MNPDNTPEQTTYVAPATSKSNPFIIPAAILIGFGLIAAAIFFSGATDTSGTAPVTGTAPEEKAVERSEIRPIDEDDHIRGNPNAPIVILEYSDYDCPFCKNYHETMNKIMDDYGSTGKVAWVFRHFPIKQLHPNARTIALASECVADLGGNDAFWKFSDLIFSEREINAQTNMTKLALFATQSGVNEDAYNSCVTDKKFVGQVDADFADAANAGAQGTPYSLVLVGGQQGVINGAQPYEAVKQIMETLLTQIENKTE